MYDNLYIRLKLAKYKKTTNSDEKIRTNKLYVHKLSTFYNI